MPETSRAFFVSQFPTTRVWRFGAMRLVWIESKKQTKHGDYSVPLVHIRGHVNAGRAALQTNGVLRICFLPSGYVGLKGK